MAQAVGRWIGEHGGQLVYGGGRTGLMGTVAEATRAAGGRVVGIIPKALVDKELRQPRCATNCTSSTPCTSARRMMGERADAFIALPGGIGTFEELFEIWTWRQLGYHDKPIGILNVAGYYDALLAFLAPQRARRLHGRLADGPDAHRRPTLADAARDAAASNEAGRHPARRQAWPKSL